MGKRVFCVAWTLVEPSLIISGSDDQTVRLWDYLQQEHASPPILEAGRFLLAADFKRIHVIQPT